MVRVWVLVYSLWLVVGSFFLVPSSYAKTSSVALNTINQRVSDRFEEDVNKLAAIMEELRNRQNIKETRVAYGSVDTPVEEADYWVNFAAEAIAYQRAQNYNSAEGLRGSLEVLKGKILRAKAEVKQALNYEK